MRLTTASALRSRFLGSAAICAAALLAACDGASLPGPSSRHATVPAQSVNAESVGLIRLRFDRKAQNSGPSRRAALGNWMAKHGLECPKLDYLLDQLEGAGFDTAIAVIPGDSTILDDAGLYVGGPDSKSAEDLEDVLIKVGGFSLGGVAASKLQVIPIGSGWYYVGINGDGVIEGASDAAAERMSQMLEHIGDRPACAAVPIEGLDDAISDIAPGDQSRMVRRLRAVASALEAAVALAVGVSTEGRSEVIIVFPDEESAAALDKAMGRIRRDMNLAVDGSLEQREITAEEADRDRRMIEALRATQRGRTVVLYEEAASAS
jgi:hypothetical protein